MMLSSKFQNKRSEGSSELPQLTVKRVGIVSRDYRVRFPNGIRDFSHHLREIIEFLNKKKCDSVLFSLFSFHRRRKFDVISKLSGLKNIQGIFFEEFVEVEEEREAEKYFLVYQRRGVWKGYSFEQQFASLSDISDQQIKSFVQDELPKRVCGNCCVLLCGETNGVKFSPKEMVVKDVFGLRGGISKEACVILNPIHDRMTRYEMVLKRQFLSQNGRWVISVWNKGRVGPSGKSMDGSKPPWQVFFDGSEVKVEDVSPIQGIEMGIVEVG